MELLKQTYSNEELQNVLDDIEEVISQRDVLLTGKFEVIVNYTKPETFDINNSHYHDYTIDLRKISGEQLEWLNDNIKDPKYEEFTKDFSFPYIYWDDNVFTQSSRIDGFTKITFEDYKQLVINANEGKKNEGKKNEI